MVREEIRYFFLNTSSISCLQHGQDHCQLLAKAFLGGVLYLKTDWLVVSVSCSCQKSLHGAPECTVCQAMKVIDKSQWRPQDIGNAGNMGIFSGEQQVLNGVI